MVIIIITHIGIRLSVTPAFRRCVNIEVYAKMAAVANAKNADCMVAGLKC